MKRICKQCGKEFFLSNSEIDFYKNKNLSIPKRCKACREANKNDRLNSEKSGNNGNRLIYYSVALVAIVVFIYLFNSAGNSAGNSADIPKTVAVETEAAEDRLATTETDVIETTETVEENTTETEVVEETGEEEVEEEVEEEGPKTTNPDSVDYEEEANRLLTFRNEEALNKHYQKHGIEMGFASAEEYERAAANVVFNKAALHKKEAEDNDDIFYIEETNEIVFVSKYGFIRTYFNPDRGIAYYNEQ